MVYCYLDRFVWILQENLKLNRNFMFHLTLFFSHASVDHQPTDWGKSKSPLSELWSVGKLIGEYYRCDASYKKATPTEALGFISSLPQLAWDKRLCCCCCWWWYISFQWGKLCLLPWSHAVWPCLHVRYVHCKIILELNLHNQKHAGCTEQPSVLIVHSHSTQISFS